ncbi:MAG: TspO/MBR family protein [Vibrio sp.]
MTKQQKVVGFLVWVVLCFGASALGAVASIHAKLFYAQLIRPDWAPPGWIFAPVWTLLFAMMAIAIWRVWSLLPPKQSRLAVGLFICQLAFNALWSWLFFAWQSGGWALVDILLLWGLILSCVVIFWRTSKLAALLLVPYLLWVSFAGVLNYALWQMNPNILALGW